MPRSFHLISLISLQLLTSASPSAHAQCEIGWSNPIQFDYPIQRPYVTCEFDEDGSGPNLPLTLFAGYVDSAGGISIDGIAAWDGTYWRSFPSAGTNNGEISAMSEFDSDGAGPLVPQLWIAGAFNSVNGVAAAGIARYDHGVWHGTAGGVPTFPFSEIRRFFSWDVDGNGPEPRTACSLCPE